MGIFDRIRKGSKKGDEVSGREKDSSGISGSPKVEISKGTEILSAWRMEELSKFEPSFHPEPSTPFVPSVPSAPSARWPDEASKEAEIKLNNNGIQIPWHHGDKFGDRFKVVGLRAGGIGAVFFVEDTRFERRLYAAKTLQHFLHKDYLEMPAHTQKKIADAFLEEALPWLEMGQQANIVTVHLLENIIHPQTKRNIPFVFSEFMEKGDLRNLVIEKERLLEETFSVGLQICEGLLHAYKHGLSAHKDLKPDNIMVYKDGIYKVTDFSAGVMGTFGCMAPEQVIAYYKRHGISLVDYERPIDHHADQFAVGLIMHDVFKGDPQNEQKKRIDYIRFDPGRFVKEGIGEVLSDELPASLKGIVTRCLQPGIKDRFDDVSLLKKELLKVYKAESKKEYQYPRAEAVDSFEWWYNRGQAYYDFGRYANAEINYKKAIRKLEVIRGKELELAGCFLNIGACYWSADKVSQAEENYMKALTMFKTIHGTEIYQADCLLNLGNLHWKTGEFLEAEKNLNEAIRIYESIPGTERNQAYCILSIGSLYHSTGRLSKAEEKYLEALRRFRVIPGTESNQAICLTNLGNCYCITRFSEAELKHREALDILSALPGTEIEQAGCLQSLGVVYWSTKRFSEAEAMGKKALDIYRAIGGEKIGLAKCLNLLGAIYVNISKFLEAEKNSNEALDIFSSLPGTEIDQARCSINLGHTYRSTKRFSEAEVKYNEALGILRGLPGTEVDQANCFMSLGILYRQIQKFGKAREVIEKALKICDQYPLGTEQIKNACLELLKQLK